jgi:hypothetical protein
MGIVASVYNEPRSSASGIAGSRHGTGRSRAGLYAALLWADFIFKQVSSMGWPAATQGTVTLEANDQSEKQIFPWSCKLFVNISLVYITAEGKGEGV